MREPRSAGAGARPAFSLIELLFVMLILGLLTLVAVPKIRGMKRRAYTNALTTDLRNLMMTQELYWNDADRYSADLAELRFTSSPDVVITIPMATRSGWAAQATHAPSGITCAVFYGTAPALAPAESAGRIACQ